jgi:hypothetical protein
MVTKVTHWVPSRLEVWRLYNRVVFVAAESAEGDWLLEVLIDGVIVGRIRRQPWSEAYRYYRVPGNDRTPFYEEKELENLLKQVALRP